VPLSEEEQRVLDEIEKNFYGTDPDLARSVATPPKAKPQVQKTHIGVGVFALIAGLLIVTFGYTAHPLIGLVGVIAMIWGGVHVWQAVAARVSEFSMTDERVTMLRDRFRRPGR
jgi:Protein of unknown function (DUF3040)